MKNWKITIGAIAAVLMIFMVVGAVWNYTGLIKNQEEQNKEREKITYTKDAEKPKAGESREKQAPKLELTQTTVLLEIGAIFDPVDYIKIAEDAYGYSIKSKVEIDAAIPTDKAGKYEVTYILKIDSENVIKRKLLVEVKNMVE